MLRRKQGDNEMVSSMAAGNNHLLVLTTHGTIYSWGAGGRVRTVCHDRLLLHVSAPIFDLLVHSPQ